MSSLQAKDRVSLCGYTYADHRKCLTPRSPAHPHFCYFHARRESQSISAAKLTGDLEYFFSGRYTSANDLSAALGRLLPAVIRGEIKPGLARTIAYLAQTMLQTIQVAQKEYIYAFGASEWSDQVRTNSEGNFDRLNHSDTQSPNSTIAESENPEAPADQTEPDDSLPTPESTNDANEYEAVEISAETQTSNKAAAPNRCDPGHHVGSASSSHRATHQPSSPVLLTSLEATLAKH